MLQSICSLAKVFDYEVEFSPTAEEAANIVFNYDDGYERKIIENS